MFPPLAPARPGEWLHLPFSLCFWATSSPVDKGLLLLAGFPDGGEHWIMGNVLIIFAITYVC